MRELDGDAVRLAAVGLVRLGAQDWLSTEGGAPAWVGGLRAASFADAWLAFGDGPASGLRAPAPEVLRAVVARAAELVLRSCREDGPAALEWLGQRSAEAREQAHREGASHPAEPCALTLVWHGVQALTAEDGPDHARRIEERAEAYVRERHCRQDTLALVLCCTRIAAAALVELCEGDPERVAGRLEQDAARSMPRAGLVPLWVPGRPALPAG
ncbi:hypothetical protein DR950_39345 [Kitasatospora xanthocidica]|uniref:Uncharacterized protein n=1 Tax=Kitasatospora xanthocidica TaxID=83382 RepID=A0A372ZJ00_9ACTN|nr:hypothetical protein [Kitasatospora xanthocidica]RGD55430.1 hypothetical protein DR950_39345 [Kitasatospora xanthocidica]